MMKKRIVFSLATLTLLTVFVAAPIYAQDASTSSPASSSGDQTKQGLMEHISKIIEQRREQVKGVMDKMGQQKRGYIAEVKGVMGTNLTISNSKGTQILTISPSIIIVKENKKATIDDIAIGDWVIVMGYNDPQGNFTLRRLLVSSQSLQPAIPDIFVGTLQSVARTQLSLLPRRVPNPVAFTIAPAKTRLQDFQGKTITLSDLKIDTEYLVLSTTNQQNQRLLSLIHSLAPPAIATPSPTTAGNSGGQ